MRYTWEDSIKARLTDRAQLLLAVEKLIELGVPEEIIPVRLAHLFYVDMDETMLLIFFYSFEEGKLSKLGSKLGFAVLPGALRLTMNNTKTHESIVPTIYQAPCLLTFSYLRQVIGL
jgi:hypothetical protein